MDQTTGTDRHPLLRAVEGVASLVDDAVEANPVFLTTAEKQRVLTGLTEQITRLESLRAKTLAVADDLAEAHGTRHAGAWLAHATRQDSARGNSAQRLAEGLDRRWPLLAEAYAAGQATTAQVRVIGHGLDALPADLDADLRVKAEAYLVEQAALFEPQRLRIIAAKVLDVIAPEIGEAHEARLLEREEQAAHDKASLSWRRLGNGLSQATVKLPDAVIDRWLTQLHAFTSPRREAAVAPEDRRPHPTKLAHAFQTLLERIPEDWLPQHGGTTTTLVVTLDHDQLTRQLATAGLLTGTRISAGEARRLACGAGILPAVLDSRSQPLDLGRTKRLFTPAQRKAMAIRDQRCRAEGCSTPAAWTEAHHLQPWTTGGKTDLAHGILLCPFHHHRTHDTRYDHHRLPNGDLRYHRRT